MGLLRALEPVEEVVLYPEHTLGRSKNCLLKVSHPGVSALHAMIFWVDDGWFIKDLGSKNGTFLNGRRVMVGAREPLQCGIRVELGAAGPMFELADDSPPQPLLVAADDPTFYRWISDSLAVPSEEQPEALLFQEASGTWCLESENGRKPIDEHGIFSLGGRIFRLIASRGVPATATAEEPLALVEALLKFGVSSDEEHVELTVEARGRSVSLGNRAHHYLLLTLARERQKAETLESSEGWIERLELERMLRQTQQHINLAVWRARRQFSEAGFSDAANIVERRGSELRIGSSRFEITRL